MRATARSVPAPPSCSLMSASRNTGGTRRKDVPLRPMGTMNGMPLPVWSLLRSTAHAHSRRNLPCARASVASDKIGMNNRACDLMYCSIRSSHGSPLSSWSSSNHVTTPFASSACLNVRTWATSARV